MQCDVDHIQLLSGHNARSIVNNNAMNNEEVDVEDEESDEEHREDVVLEEIGNDSDEDESTDTRKLKRSR